MTQAMHTLRQIAERIGAKPETLRKRLSRAGMPAGLDTPLDETQVALLFEAGQVRKSRKVIKRARVGQTTKASPEPVQNEQATYKTSGVVHHAPDAKKEHGGDFVQRALSALADTLLILIIVGHGLLIVQELTEMAGQIGRTAGLMVALSIIAAVVLSSRSRWFSVSGDTLWFVFIIDFAAIYLHYRAFEPSLGAGLAIGLACVVSSVAFFSLYAFRSKNSNLFDFDGD